MSRIHFLQRFAGFVFGAVVLCAGTANASPSLGVAGFGGDVARGAASQTVASELAEAIASRGVKRVLRPGSFVARAGIDPSASDVRNWAYAAALDALILGQVSAASDGSPERLVVVVRSGHSGGERSRHALDLPEPAERADALARLADEILVGLGYELPGKAPSGPGVAAGPAAGNAAAADRGRGLDAAFDSEGFDGGAPIEIKAEEAEIVSGDHGRELLFQRNVHVTQANVTLRSERLEATYKRGESEPEKLVANGEVYVDQGGRRAKCDRAVYLRKDQRLTCSGRAELVQGCDIVRGDSIEFWLSDDRARVEGAASIVIRPEHEEGSGCKEMGDRS